MAISTDAVWEVRVAGNDTNGGGFVTGSSGTDYSQQDAKNTATGTDDSTTDAVANGSTTLTSATANFQASIVGNIIFLSGGTGALAATRRQVTARTNSTTITVDAVVATGTGITMNIGGACATHGGASVNFASGNTMWIKSGTYSMTSASNNVNGGGFSRVGYVLGYGSARGDFGAKPLIQASGISTFTFFSQAGAGFVRHVIVDGAGLTASTGFSLSSTGAKVGDCEARNCTAIAFSSVGLCVNCIATGCSGNTQFTGAGKYIACVAKDGTVSGFRDGWFFNCIADSNSGASTDGFLMNSNTTLAVNCVAYNQGRHGFHFSNNVTTAINCIAEDNAGTGYVHTGNPIGLVLANCAAYSNGTDFSIGTGKNNYNTDSVTGSASFFTDPANGDFSLNTTAGGGADARGAGYPTTYNDGDTPNFLDIGVAQHDDPVGGGGASSYAFFG